MQATDSPSPQVSSQAAPQQLDPGSLAAWLRLQLTAGVGAASGAALIAALHPPPHVFDAEPAVLHAVLAEVLSASLVGAAAISASWGG